eukprot:GHVT01088470.1.p1 GENE.GHVT01088470.1~~GHVT01088470.1.p1  ORF type:complete len:142 (+),score=6.37 GHVT01088470.1:537-962(+)
MKQTNQPVSQKQTDYIRYRKCRQPRQTRKVATTHMEPIHLQDHKFNGVSSRTMGIIVSLFSLKPSLKKIKILESHSLESCSSVVGSSGGTFRDYTNHTAMAQGRGNYKSLLAHVLFSGKLLVFNQNHADPHCPERLALPPG